MPCYSPIVAWYGEKTEKGKRKLVFDRVKAEGQGLEIPCGKCIGCRLERSRQWAVRCMHEAQMHESNCFITLTYNNEKLPSGGTLVKRDLQLFFKKLRKFYHARTGQKLRYFAAGEYGEQFGRAHYHALLFGIDFMDDRKEHPEVRSQEGFEQYVSPTLDRIWGNGMTAIGSLTFESAAYVARYCTKKITGDSAGEHYQGREPEFALMSRRPGIGAEFYQRFASDITKDLSVVVRGTETSAPQYYARRFEREQPEEYLKVKERLKKKVKYVYPLHLRLGGYPVTKVDSDYERLKVKEQCKKAQISMLKRRFESGEY